MTEMADARADALAARRGGAAPDIGAEPGAPDPDADSGVNREEFLLGTDVPLLGPLSPEIEFGFMNPYEDTVLEHTAISETRRGDAFGAVQDILQTPIALLDDTQTYYAAGVDGPLEEREPINYAAISTALSDLKRVDRFEADGATLTAEYQEVLDTITKELQRLGASNEGLAIFRQHSTSNDPDISNEDVAHAALIEIMLFAGERDTRICYRQACELGVSQRVDELVEMVTEYEQLIAEIDQERLNESYLDQLAELMGPLTDEERTQVKSEFERRMKGMSLADASFGIINGEGLPDPDAQSTGASDYHYHYAQADIIINDGINAETANDIMLRAVRQLKAPSSAVSGRIFTYADEPAMENAIARFVGNLPLDAEEIQEFQKQFSSSTALKLHKEGVTIDDQRDVGAWISELQIRTRDPIDLDNPEVVPPERPRTAALLFHAGYKFTDEGERVELAPEELKRAEDDRLRAPLITPKAPEPAAERDADRRDPETAALAEFRKAIREPDLDPATATAAELKAKGEAIETAYRALSIVRGNTNITQQQVYAAPGEGQDLLDDVHDYLIRVTAAAATRDDVAVSEAAVDLQEYALSIVSNRYGLDLADIDSLHAEITSDKPKGKSQRIAKAFQKIYAGRRGDGAREALELVYQAKHGTSIAAAIDALETPEPAKDVLRMEAAGVSIVADVALALEKPPGEDEIRRGVVLRRVSKYGDGLTDVADEIAEGARATVTATEEITREITRAETAGEADRVKSLTQLRDNMIERARVEAERSTRLRRLALGAPDHFVGLYDAYRDPRDVDAMGYLASSGDLDTLAETFLSERENELMQTLIRKIGAEGVAADQVRDLLGDLETMIDDLGPEAARERFGAIALQFELRTGASIIGTIKGAVTRSGYTLTPDNKDTLRRLGLASVYK